MERFVGINSILMMLVINVQRRRYFTFGTDSFNNDSFLPLVIKFDTVGLTDD